MYGIDSKKKKREKERVSGIKYSNSYHTGVKCKNEKIYFCVGFGYLLLLGWARFVHRYKFSFVLQKSKSLGRRTCHGIVQEGCG